MPKIFKFRVFNKNFAKAEAIVNTRTEAEALVPNGERRYVKRFQGRVKLATYLVERSETGKVRWSVLSNE